MSLQRHLTYLGAVYVGLAALNVLVALGLYALMAAEGLPPGGAGSWPGRSPPTYGAGSR